MSASNFGARIPSLTALGTIARQVERWHWFAPNLLPSLFLGIWTTGWHRYSSNLSCRQETRLLPKAEQGSAQDRQAFPAALVLQARVSLLRREALAVPRVVEDELALPEVVVELALPVMEEELALLGVAEEVALPWVEGAFALPGVEAVRSGPRALAGSPPAQQEVKDFLQARQALPAVADSVQKPPPVMGLAHPLAPGSQW